MPDPNARSTSTAHTEKHRAQIRNQPDKPDDNAKLVKTRDQSFILFHQNYGGPDGVNEHQDNSQQAGQAMDAKRHPPRRVKHQSGTPSIANEAQTKENQVPGL